MYSIIVKISKIYYCLKWIFSFNIYLVNNVIYDDEDDYNDDGSYGGGGLMNDGC